MEKNGQDPVIILRAPALKLPCHEEGGIRIYDPFNAAEVEIKGTDTNAAFWKLLQYIQGNNVKKQKIPMTVPVFFHENRLGFALPASSYPPYPIDKGIKIITYPADLKYQVLVTKRPVKLRQTWKSMQKHSNGKNRVLAVYTPPSLWNGMVEAEILELYHETPSSTKQEMMMCMSCHRPMLP